MEPKKAGTEADHIPSTALVRGDKNQIRLEAITNMLTKSND